MIVPLQIEIQPEKKDEPFRAHRIFCIDCSGSMSDSLPEIATQLKNKIPTLIGPNDFMTLIWFSGRGQFGTIFEHISVNDVQDIQKINTAIDRYLHIVGSTGFVEPIRLAKELAQKYSEVPQIFFLSDGGENSWSKEECEKTFEDMRGIPLVIVEYQYYCDRQFLTRLAEISEATSIFNEDFKDYDDSFELYMKNRIDAKSNCYIVEVKDNSDAVFMDNEQLVIRRSSNGKVLIPFDVTEAYMVNENWEMEENDENEENEKNKKMYMGMLYALKDKKSKMMSRLVKMLGDVYITRLYSSCFSKQDYSRLSEHIRQCILHPEGNAFREGKDCSFVVEDNAFTVVDLLNLLESDNASRFYPYHPSFQYARISKEVKDEKVRFSATRDIGSEFSLVYNQSRANISLGCVVYGYNTIEKEDGSVDISPTTAYRNYAILKDGIKNVKILPVSLSETVFNELVKQGILSSETYIKNKIYLVDITNLPVVNRLFINQPFTSTEFCHSHLHIHTLKTEIKFLKKMMEMNKKEEDENGNENEENKYVRKERDATVVRDFYVAPELQVKIAKCSSIPTVNDKLLSKLGGSGSLTVSEAMFKNIYEQYKNNENNENWLKKEMESRKKELKKVTSYVEQAKMALLIGCVWFSDVTAETQTFSLPYLPTGVTYSVTVEINDAKVYMD